MERKNKAQTTPDHVETKDVFATFVAQADMIGKEVAARRAFDEDVADYLKEKGLIEDFESWREKRASRPR